MQRERGPIAQASSDVQKVLWGGEVKIIALCGKMQASGEGFGLQGVGKGLGERDAGVYPETDRSCHPVLRTEERELSVRKETAAVLDRV